MAVLGPIVEMATDLLAVDISDLLHSGNVGPEPVGDDSPRCAGALHRISQEPQGRCFVTGFRNIAFEKLAFMIHSAPEVIGLAVDLHTDLVQVPPPLRDLGHIAGPPNADLARIYRSETVYPRPHNLLANIEAAFMQQALHISKQQPKPDVHHHRELDRFG